MQDNDPYDLNRFLHAQETTIEGVLKELGSGRKRSHWMWFIFPQIEGLGHSLTSKYYSIKSEDEARQYFDHAVLGKRLVQCTEAVLAIEEKSAGVIFGFPDELKLRSCMTMFECVAGSESIFARVLDKFFNGKRDEKTLDLLRKGRLMK